MTEKHGPEVLCADSLLSPREQDQAREMALVLNADLTQANSPCAIWLEIASHLVAFTLTRARNARISEQEIEAMKRFINQRAEELLTS